jgi:two-component system nitrogen regulation response regulator GlnG
MSVLRSERAAAELFGHKKGSFTGAITDSPGHFQSAAGGTLFLDELGLTSIDVQPMLLRVVEDRDVQPLGSAKTRKVDVRIVAATDAKLEQAVAAGRFDSSLYKRFNSRSSITLPPLRDRREDVGVLLVHFMRAEIADEKKLQRLQDLDPKGRPWLSVRDIAAVALSPLSGNVRDLEGLAEDLISAATDNPRGDAHEVVLDFLSRSLPGPGAGEKAANQPHAVRARSDITSDQLLAALESAGWNRTRAAHILKVSRSTLWRSLGKYPDLRRVADIRLSDLLREKEACGGDLEPLAKKLGTSVALLRRRLGRHE